MNTATTRIRAGAPALQLHRAQPIDFVMSDEEEREVRNGFDRAMRAPITKPEAEPAADATKDITESEFAYWFWTRALWTACWFGLGVMYARHFS